MAELIPEPTSIEESNVNGPVALVADAVLQNAAPTFSNNCEYNV